MLPEVYDLPRSREAEVTWHFLDQRDRPLLEGGDRAFSTFFTDSFTPSMTAQSDLMSFECGNNSSSLSRDRRKPERDEEGGFYSGPLFQGPVIANVTPGV